WTSGEFKYTIPAGTSYVLANFNNQNPSRPIEQAIVVINPPQVYKGSLDDVYAAIKAESGNELVGIKYAALGDSITSLAQGNTYASRIATWIESEEYTNYALPGATMAYRSGTTPTDDPDQSDDTNVVPNQVRKLVKA